MNGYIYCTEDIEKRLREVGCIPHITTNKENRIILELTSIANRDVIAVSYIRPVGKNTPEFYCSHTPDNVYEVRYMKVPHDTIETLAITEDKLYSDLFSFVNDKLAPSPHLEVSDNSCNVPVWDNTTELVQSYVKRNTSWQSTFLRLKLNMYKKLYKVVYGVSEWVRVKHTKTERELISETNRLHGYKESQPLIEGVK